MKTLGTAYYDAKDFVMADKEFQRALSIRLGISKKPTPAEEEIRWCLCRTYLAQDRLEEAQQMFEKCMEIEQTTNNSLHIKNEYDGLIRAKDRFQPM